MERVRAASLVDDEQRLAREKALADEEEELVKQAMMESAMEAEGFADGHE
jgi:hypothetical protein